MLTLLRIGRFLGSNDLAMQEIILRCHTLHLTGQGVRLRNGVRNIYTRMRRMLFASFPTAITFQKKG